jgi:hypothetical protein
MRCLIFLCGAFLCSSGAPADTTPAAALCQKGQTAMKRGSLDEALGYFTAASSAGLPRDSLYYFLSSIYYAKGAYDTALAFNFGIKPASQHLAIRQFEQRYAIYKALSWDNDAEALNDSLMKLRAYLLRFLIPQISARAGADYADRRETDQPFFPYGDSRETQTYAGPGFTGNVSLQWVVPFSRLFLLKAGISGLITSKYFRTAMSNDSVNRSVSFFASLTHAPSGLSLEYDIRRAIDFIGDYTTLNSISLNRAETGTKWMSLVSLGYENELGPHYERQDQRFWIVGYADQAPVKHRGWGFSLMASYYDALALGYYETANVMYVNNVHASPVIHYTDARAKDTIPTPSTVYPYYLNSDSNAALINSRIFPQRQFLITPSVTYSLPTPLACTTSISFGTPVTWYPDRYVWMNIDNASNVAVYSANRIVVYNIEDGRYYWYEEPITPRPGSFIEVFSQTPLSWETKQRIDASLDASLSVKHAVWTFGTVALEAGVSKNYSTLRKEKLFGYQLSHTDAPFAIPDWSWSAGFIWNYNFSAF